MTSKGLLVGLALAAVATALAGCSGGTSNEPKRYRVSGTLIFDGKPIPYGDVLFTPDKDNPGPQGIATIRNGKFDTASDGGKGIAGGPTVIKVTGLTGENGQLLCQYEFTMDLPREDSTQDLIVPGAGKVQPAKIPRPEI
jgi:hypothetical protein